jgi:hypothetical protein
VSLKASNIEIKDELKLLGVTIDNRLTFAIHIKNVLSKVHTNEFTGVIIDTSRNVMPLKRKRKSGKAKQNNVQKQKWFDKSCHCLKKQLRNLGSLLSKYCNDTFLRHTFFGTRKAYKNLIRRLKSNFHSEILYKIQASRGGM